MVGVQEPANGVDWNLVVLIGEGQGGVAQEGGIVGKVWLQQQVPWGQGEVVPDKVLVVQMVHDSYWAATVLLQSHDLDHQVDPWSCDLDLLSHDLVDLPWACLHDSVEDPELV